MSMLAKIRQRPDNEKRVMALVTAGVLTVAILVLWWSFTSPSQMGVVVTESKLSSVSPWQVIKDDFSRIFSESFDKINK